MSDDGSIEIRIKAGLDRSVEASFGTVDKMVERTGRNVQKAFGGGAGGGAGAAISRSMRLAARDAEKAERDIERTFAQQVKAAEKASNDEYKAHLKAARETQRLAEKTAKDRIKFAAQVEREIDRGLMRETRALERAERRKEQIAERAARKVEASNQRFASRTSHRSVRFLFPNPIGAFGMASRIGSDILRGAGVDFSVAGSVSRAVNAQALATQLSSQGYMKGEAGPNGTRVAASTLEKEARATATAQRFDPEAMLRAQTKFVDITGNLNDAREAMPSIAALSGATGTDPEKMAEAWANVSRHMGDIPDKAKKVEGLMRLIAGQGRVGSIEIKDEAKDLAKIAAAADRFAGSDKAATIGKLTTLAQMARAQGGAASSAQAATAVASFTGTFAAPERIKAFRAAGLKESDIFSLDKKGNRTAIQDPFEIIKKSLTATGGDLVKMSNLFKSVMAGRAVNALTAAYNGAGGGKAGLAAVDKTFSQFGTEATLSEDQVKENNAERFKTDAAKAQEFQNALDGVVSEAKGELIPALTELKDPALAAAKGLSEIVSFSAKHPMEAVGIAVAAAIARAGVESAFRAGVEKMITGAMASGSGIQMLAPVAITIAAATIVAHLIDEDIKQREDEQRASAVANGNAGALESEARISARKGVITDKNRDDLSVIDANLEERITRVNKLKHNEYGVYDPNAGAAMVAAESVINPTKFAARQDANHLAELKTELADNKRILDMIRTGTLRVMVTNPGDIGGGNGPRVYAAGREHAPGELPAYLRRPAQ